MARQINPILTSIQPTEILSDPFVRELYFGSTDTPGLIRQATDAAQKAILDQPAILQETAGLSPDEIRAREIARAGIGSFQPFLRTAQESFGRGLGALQGSIGFGGPSARQLLRGSLRGFDPSMTGQFFNPFEEQVVQQTIDDTLRAAAQQDIAQRASDIARGGQSAFGSRARLTAEERQRGLGRGLGEVLSKIRSGGFLTAQDRALQELQRQRDAARQAASLEQGFGQDLSAAQRLFGSDIADLGATQQRLRGIDIANLTGLGATERGIEEQRLARQFAQQQATRDAPLLATQFIQGFAPKYVSGQTTIDKTYGIPKDPLAVGLGGFLSAYSATKRPLQYTPPQTSNTGPTQQQSNALDQYMKREGIRDVNRDAKGDPIGGTFLSSELFRTPTLPQFDTTTPFGQAQILSGGGFKQPNIQSIQDLYNSIENAGAAPDINLPRTLPPAAPSFQQFGLPQQFNPNNPGINLPYNPFGPSR
jgi:hypothetical protein